MIAEIVSDVQARRAPENSNGLGFSSEDALAAIRMHNIWHGMRQRCFNPKANSYHRYGGRGIKICREWDDFINFFETVPAGYSPKKSLDRIDNDGNYCPENCRWSTFPEQMDNRGCTHYITINGETKTLSEWSRHTGIHPETIRARVKHYGVTGEKIISKASVRIYPKSTERRDNQQAYYVWVYIRGPKSKAPVCDEWQSFAVFIQEMGARPIDYRLERKDKRFGYSKENCEWVPISSRL